MANSSWAPNETSSQIFNEEMWLQGTLLANVGYGVCLTLFVMCVHLLVKQMDHRNMKRQLFLLTYISIIFTLGTLYIGGNTKYTHQMFIEYRNYPGGPDAYERAMFSSPVDELASVAFIAGNWFMDAFLVCYTTMHYLDTRT